MTSMNNNYIRYLDFYTDGSYSSKSEMGGWAAICIENGVVIDTQTGYEPYTTGNRMELFAFLSALESISTIKTGHTKVIIYTDSAYIANCFKDGWWRKWINNGWKTADRQEVKNQELWSRIIALYIKYNERYDLEIIKVKGHSGNQWNEYVDLLAKKSKQVLEDLDEEMN